MITLKFKSKEKDDVKGTTETTPEQENTDSSNSRNNTNDVSNSSRNDDNSNATDSSNKLDTKVSTKVDKNELLKERLRKLKEKSTNTKTTTQIQDTGSKTEKGKIKINLRTSSSDNSNTSSNNSNGNRPKQFSRPTASTDQLSKLANLTSLTKPKAKHARGATTNNTNAGMRNSTTNSELKEKEQHNARSLHNGTNSNSTSNTSIRDKLAKLQRPAEPKTSDSTGGNDAGTSDTSKELLNNGTGTDSTDISNATSTIGATSAVSKAVSTVLLNKDQITKDHLNSQQLLAVDKAVAGESFCLIGGAGSGKTTTVRTLAQELVSSGVIGKMEEGTKRVLRMNAPSIAVLSFTNPAVRNIKEALPIEFKPHCSTIHMLLEYEPDFYQDLVDGEFKTKMRFVPKYGTTNYKDPHAVASCTKLPHIDMIVLEEAGSIPTDLFNILLSALPNPKSTVFIFLGDLNQLAPVFDDAILGFKLIDLPLVELTDIYRNVGLVTKLAQRILTGKGMTDKECTEWNLSDESGSIKFMQFGKSIDWELALKATGNSFRKMAKEGRFNPDEDVVLIPFNVKFGQIEMNKYILQGLSERNNVEVHHVKAGYNDHYLGEGDKVMFNKYYWKIAKIVKNTDYFGDTVLPASVHLDRWGQYDKEYRDEVLGLSDGSISNDDISEVDALLEAASNAFKGDPDEQGIAKRAASHVVTLVRPSDTDPDENVTMSIASAGDINEMQHVNAMTVHKAQGSEFSNVYLILHQSHSVSVKRELIYTGVTRARKNITIIYDGQQKNKIGNSMMQKGIVRQEIKGNTIQDKLKYFLGKREAEAVRAKIAAAKVNDSIKEIKK